MIYNNKNSGYEIEGGGMSVCCLLNVCLMLHMNFKSKFFFLSNTGGLLKKKKKKLKDYLHRT